VNSPLAGYFKAQKIIVYSLSSFYLRKKVGVKGIFIKTSP